MTVLWKNDCKPLATDVRKAMDACPHWRAKLAALRELRKAKAKAGFWVSGTGSAVPGWTTAQDAFASVSTCIICPFVTLSWSKSYNCCLTRVGRALLVYR